MEETRRYRLRQRTREAHVALETEATRGCFFVSREMFAEFLAAQLPLHQACATLRAGLSRTGPAEHVWSAPGCLPAMLGDLRVLGVAPGGYAEGAEELMMEHSHSIALYAGLSYVAEGSLLGGRQIMKQWGKALGLTPQQGARFLNTSRRYPHRWKDFCVWLERLDFAPSQEEQVVEAANRAFQQLDIRLRCASRQGQAHAATGPDGGPAREGRVPARER